MFKRNVVAVLLAMSVLLTLTAAHGLLETMGEDQAPIWSCHTMGNRDCGPGTPWHGLVIGS